MPEPTIWTLPVSPQAAGLARRYLSAAATDLSEETLADAQLLVTEVVKNAVHHGSAPVTMKLTQRPSGIRVEVRDSGAGLPQLTASQGATGGRGLQMLEVLAAAWGVVPEPADRGKTVWFDVSEPASLRRHG